MTEKEWHKAHRYCPKCGHSVAQTLVGVFSDPENYHDDVNYADCFDFMGGCGWRGKLYECISEKDIRKLKLDKIDKRDNK